MQRGTAGGKPVGGWRLKWRAITLLTAASNDHIGLSASNSERVVSAESKGAKGRIGV